MKLPFFLLAVMPIFLATPAQAAPSANQIYYTVAASRQGSPEDLWEIATRFLGSPSRASEILELNSGRLQPDGDRLADASRLHEGWQLILPWDAVGNELHHGPLPATAGSSSGCNSGDQTASSWAQALLTPKKAWTVANGAGVQVAIIGSGVDGAVPALAGRVTAGADVATGTARGDTACDGTGTPLAGLVAGDDDLGVAPGAQIFPVKVGTDPSQAATGIRVAAAAGARVILVSADVAAADPQVRGAISDAISQDAVVVVPASAGATKADGMLRTGAIGQDRKPATDYPADAVDLLAPGLDVASIGGTVSGPEYAAAFVAGTTALVRAAHPELHAAEAAARVLATVADGVVSPVAAVTTPLPTGVGANAAAKAPSSGLGTLSQVLLWTAVALAVLLLVPFLLQRPARQAARFWSARQARRNRPRPTDDNEDPFWDPPTSVGAGDPPTQVNAR
ncbi:S8 family serine peptidase [Actinoplanes sp. NPDC026619]|uniref:S8 family serine peptidase n=1 Tax=Actinoplanes sp. NPDC026619 TaxID=3155798 RepID=UPI0033CA9760